MIRPQLRDPVSIHLREFRERAAGARTHVPLRERGHVLRPAEHGSRTAQGAGELFRHEDVAQRRILPARYEEGEVGLRGRDEPGTRRVGLVAVGQRTVADELVQVLVGEASFVRGVCGAPQFE